MDVESLFGVKGKVVLVTGGAKGIGRMISEGFVANGARVYIASRSEKDLQKAVDEMRPKGFIEYIQADLSKVEGCQKVAQTIAQKEGKLDVLVNNSGNNWGTDTLEAYPDSAWERVLTLNLQRVFTLTQLCVPLLEKAQSAGNPGRIINIGSVDALRTSNLHTYAYSASKAGLHHMSRVLSYHLGIRNITSNTIACGPFQSKMMAATLQKSQEKIVSGIPLHRIGAPSDVAGTCIYLASKAGAYANGTTITIDGGGVTAARL